MNTAPSVRTQVKRGVQRASYDTALLHAIVDAAYICHIAFDDEHGVHNIPTACWRSGGHLYIHGSNGSRMLKRLAEQECCVTITHVDGLVLARSAFNHSMNYRSAMIYGRFETVTDAGKRAALEALMEHLLPGRQADVRPGNEQEYAATTVMRIALHEAACKVRTGGPKDDEEDLPLAVWAGVLPLTQSRPAPQPDPACSLPAPDYVRAWQD
ncbi:pyridoxamine 5'-phosphate oxidase family protein [Massilia sp. 9096]|uniref:pyridoxamine 5'-phosphate oxidase family protein n=1 Tax=Massilia sp. 9096 TaxID=1500894 RepID=UPI00055BF26A|nr:pyridoxamine 5'-phosphate oxidase family protein [Massilia sp. 9096]